MRRLRTGGLVVALLALLGMVSGCGSAPASPAVTGASADAKHEPAATPTGITASQVIWDKEHGVVPPVHGGTKYVKHADLLDGVSCGGAQCVAVGAYYYGVKSGENTLVEVWSGKAWTLQPSPNGPRDSWLTAVSCAPANPPGTCLAVGNIVLARSEGHWRTLAVTSDFAAVSCAGGMCMAVGTGNRVPVYATWDGRVWRTGAMHASPPRAQEFTIRGVSCAAADNCVAVGSYSYGIFAKPQPNARNLTLAEQWNGRFWRLLPTVDVSHGDFFTAVSCVSTADCTAIGGSQELPLAERWDGTAWHVEQMPAVNRLEFDELSGVSCVSAGFCVASGTQRGEPVAVSWDGQQWRLTRLPQPTADNYSAQLTGVSCASTRECTAVGINDAAASYAEQFAAGEWRLTATQNPR